MPNFAVFRSSGEQELRFLFGNPIARRPDYELEAFNDLLGGTVKTPVVVSTPPTQNPDYLPAETLPGFAGTAAPFDARGWGSRKRIRVRQPGIQSLELDLEVLSQISSGDLRVVQQGKQLAYLSDPEWTVRELKPQVSRLEAKEPSLSLWSLQLPKSRLPILNVHCRAPEEVFQRKALLYEMAEDRRGSRERRVLASSVWRRLRSDQSRRLWLSPGGYPKSDVLFLEIGNADNPALRLDDFRVQVRVPRLVFKALSGEDLWLYYGNRRAGPPQYDIRLIASELFESPKNPAELEEEEEPLRPSHWWTGEGPSGVPGIVFWGALGLGVVLLLYVIARLLPGTDSPRDPQTPT